MKNQVFVLGMMFSAVATLGGLGACRHRRDQPRSADPPPSEVWLWQDQASAAKLVAEPLSSKILAEIHFAPGAMPIAVPPALPPTISPMVIVP